MQNPIEFLQGMMVAGILATGATGFLWFLRAKGPGILAAQMKKLINQVRASAWLRDQAHPQRARWFAATLALLEEEIPEPETNRAFYDRIGDFIAARAPSVLASPKKWADAMEALGDSLDTELDADLKEIAAGDPPAQG